MLARLALIAFATAAAQAGPKHSTDGAFSLSVEGGALGETRGNTVFAWGNGRGARVSVDRFSETLENDALLGRTRTDAQRLRKKGRRVDAPKLLAGAVPFSLTGFAATSFGYFNADGNTYSYLVKGLRRAQAAELMRSLRERQRAEPPVRPGPPPATDAELPPAAGVWPLLGGRLEFPEPKGWRFVDQNDGWLLLEGPDWSFALSARVIEELPEDQKGTVQGTAAAYFARFELDFVQNRGCQASPIDGGALVNDWKMLFKTYQCPGMAAERRQVVGILLPTDLPMLGWTGDYDRPQTLALFEKWLSAGRRTTPSAMAAQAPAANKTSPLWIAVAGGILGFSTMILLLIRRRRKRTHASE